MAVRSFQGLKLIFSVIGKSPSIASKREVIGHWNSRVFYEYFGCVLYDSNEEILLDLGLDCRVILLMNTKLHLISNIMEYYEINYLYNDEVCREFTEKLWVFTNTSYQFAQFVKSSNEH
ncbi:CLUMA_CG018336, isoform A [Clunio marinus]|uniref:CLUMA_CG018336, isoform A n=1 Tax=Clunio marinus TaxID=568069 RepID=A0A1J1J411_9DIPT|nr:CLUMA_CG018336, isoform A [Clunio marinus]